jgi:hypothetical protein
MFIGNDINSALPPTISLNVTVVEPIDNPLTLITQGSPGSGWICNIDGLAIVKSNVCNGYSG